MPNDVALLGAARYDRIKGDLYETPEWVTEALMDNIEEYFREVWEPACGHGALARVLRARNIKVYESDLYEYGGHTEVLDYLKAPRDKYKGVPIITNPPYSLATQFVEKALGEGRPFCVFLLPNEWDAPKSRRRFTRHLEDKYLLSQRIRWIEGSIGAPRKHHAWYVFKPYYCETKLHYI